MKNNFFVLVFVAIFSMQAGAECKKSHMVSVDGKRTVQCMDPVQAEKAAPAQSINWSDYVPSSSTLAATAVSAAVSLASLGFGEVYVQNSGLERRSKARILSVLAALVSPVVAFYNL